MVTLQCKECKGEYKVYEHREHTSFFCSIKCKVKSEWSNPVFREKQALSRLGQKNRKKYRRPDILGNKNPRWNNHIGYSGLHIWLKRLFGNPEYCEKCGKVGQKFENGRWNLQWSLIKGKTYTRNRKHFWGLCVSCHKFYDIERN